MQKKKIAVIFGGNSTEYEVSLHSAFSVSENINKEKIDIVPIGITRNGDWYHYTDMFYTPSNEIIFNEVNTIPGLTSHSRYPNMMKGIGLSFADMLDKLISLYVE